MSETAKINIQGKEAELPIVVGSENEIGLDISKLRAETGAVTLDFGYRILEVLPVTSLIWMERQEF